MVKAIAIAAVNGKVAPIGIVTAPAKAAKTETAQKAAPSPEELYAKAGKVLGTSKASTPAKAKKGLHPAIKAVTFTPETPAVIPPAAEVEAEPEGKEIAIVPRVRKAAPPAPPAAPEPAKPSRPSFAGPVVRQFNEAGRPRRPVIAPPSKILTIEKERLAYNAANPAPSFPPLPKVESPPAIITPSRQVLEVESRIKALRGQLLNDASSLVNVARSIAADVIGQDSGPTLSAFLEMVTRLIGDRARLAELMALIR
jgi:hypothetical protein